VSVAAPRVMLVVDPREPGVLAALDRVRAARLDAHIAVQLRMKGASDAERIAASRALSAVLPIDARMIVNESLPVARAIAADGVHLPEASGTVSEARRALPTGAIVGCSCHDAAGVVRRAGEGADYLVLGPLGDVPGKPAMSAEAFRAAATSVHVPVLALGGIASRIDVIRARELGARGVAIQRGLLGADSVALVQAALESFAS
jgi:thiamine-phosphate diphosphorylase